MTKNASDNYEPAQYRDACFTLLDKAKKTWECNLCKRTVQAGNGCSNFTSHLKANFAKHDTAKSIVTASLEKTLVKSKASLGVIELIDPVSRKYFGWIEWIVMCNLQFQFVASPFTRKYTNLETICVNTLKKYMRRLVTVVEEYISLLLPASFGIIFDGWTEGRTHFVAVFATFADLDGCLHQPLLGCGVMGDEKSQSAESFVNYLIDTLKFYGKSTESVAFVVSDNTAVNPAIARLLKVPFVGCLSHRLALAVGQYLSDADLLSVIQDIHRVMVKLSSAKLGAYLRDNGCDLAPVISNVTRWSSTYAMLERYFDGKFEDAVSKIAKDRDAFVSKQSQLAFVELLPLPVHREDLLVFLEDFKLVNDTTRYLQTASLNIFEAYETIRVLQMKLADDGWKYWISKYCETSYFPESELFVRSACKLLEDPLSSSSLSDAEKASLKRFRVDQNSTIAIDISPAKPDAPLASILEKEAKRRKLENSERAKIKVNEFSGLDGIAPTSSLVWTDLRKSMQPETLEMLLFLKVNRSLWNMKSVDAAVKFKKPNAQGDVVIIQ